MLWLVKIWKVSSCVKNLWNILKLFLIAETDRVLCNLVMFSFSTGCTKWNTAANKILKLFMAGLFIGFSVKKCAACQSHRKSDFGWIAFTHFPLLNAYYKEGSKKSQAILMAFRSILTGKPELLLYLLCFFSGFLKSIVVSAPSLCTRQWSDLQSGFTSAYRFLKSLNIFWPQAQEKGSEEYNVFSYDFGCKKKALSDILASWFILKYSKHRETSLNLQGFWSLWAYAYPTLGFQGYITLKTYLCEWKLLSQYMFHRVIFILLIVSSLSFSI